MVKLAEEDGRTMFVCRVDENLTLDEFETDNDEGLSIDGLSIQSVAANIVGEHECLHEVGSSKKHVKLVVTSEANSKNDISANSKFMAEILVKAEIVNDVKTNAEIFIQCPNSGEWQQLPAAVWRLQSISALFRLFQEILCVSERSYRINLDSCPNHLTSLHMRARRLSCHAREKANHRRK